MSQEQVKAIYKRLAQDEVFKAQIEGAESPQECSQIIREAGYDFTQEEFEAFTAQLLDSSDAENSFEGLSEKTLEAVFGVGGSAQVYGTTTSTTVLF
ncbi:Nif11-like leader peptide family natural product [Hyella patelloides LEGE 07179]|uniref:Nif11-like leader peptide family natural product n=1 Tax=Hyella patelloides LEGE 07179 TaxID=945734 RepID=A0A563W4D0_9CYAN|nr:Nif11-like leader peptide family natural product precursor [Hyella patelloides]VEP18562.1 Nif11-like leader peptide family natural product [Hyella patelloides LEGE 07179]